MNYTKGPWKIIIDNSNARTCMLWQNTPEGTPTVFIGQIRTVSDAKLVAAAPEMYELLKRLARVVRQEDYTGRTITDVEDFLERMEEKND